MAVCVSMISFELSNEGRAYVPLYIKPFEKAVLTEVMFKVDTGADLTTIDKDYLYALGYTQSWIEANAVKDETRTLSGTGDKSELAWYVDVQIFNFAGRDMKNWPIYIRIEDSRNFPNLLGLDVLSNFNFKFDYDNAVVLFESAKNPKIVLPRLGKQEVTDLGSELHEFV